MTKTTTAATAATKISRRGMLLAGLAAVSLEARRLDGWEPDPTSFEDLDQWRRTARFPGHTYHGWYWIETVEVRDFSGRFPEPFTYDRAYDPKTGLYIGEPKQARWFEHHAGPLERMDTTTFEIMDHAWSTKLGCWIGGSHRCWQMFPVGARIFEADYGDENTPFREHGSRVIRTDDDGREAARAFARYMR